MTTLSAFADRNKGGIDRAVTKHDTKFLLLVFFIFISYMNGCVFPSEYHHYTVS